MLLHLAATLLQAFFPVLQEAGFLNVRHMTSHSMAIGAKMAPGISRLFVIIQKEVVQTINALPRDIQTK